MGTPAVIFDQTPFSGGQLGASDPVGVANLQVTNLVAQENSQRKARYLSKYANYATNMASGEPIPAAQRVAPVPEMAQGLSDPDAQGFISAVETSTPVTPQLDDVFYHGITIAQQNAAKAPNVFELGGKTGNAGWFQVGTADTMPAGFEKTVPGPDGALMTVKKVCTPWGCSYEVQP